MNIDAALTSLHAVTTDYVRLAEALQEGVPVAQADAITLAEKLAGLPEPSDLAFPDEKMLATYETALRQAHLAAARVTAALTQSLEQLREGAAEQQRKRSALQAYVPGSEGTARFVDRRK